ncbi:MAG: zinc ABC transporter substrate-binding protein [Sulfitobacter sp.]|uniref:zinc ABC transporter substrate-binding protein n=1 Tax=unclassified Sulfitobacter TaxID=196795 RepID=UPI0007C3796B|nr:MULTISPECIES: zinc ABC transporter substrate-binding protein [unclassified Sulfitobacter]KZX94031.1 zinc transporter [Sulfitobacter sp. HI0021]KZY02120.1 zinc transporter [Sulfitobacter sp. HI0027]KZY99445.1 zinc transporter [Sulfitobacter sp. HI0076]
MYRFTLPAAILASAASPLWADVPAVATDIAPVHALVSQVMEGVGTPDLIVPPRSSPHGYAMRPSEARALSGADLVVWVGPLLTPWLADPLESLASSASHLALLEQPGTRVLAFREGATFEAHDHGDEGRGAEEHPEKGDDHDAHGHDAHGDEAHEEHDHEEHDDEEHGHEGHDHDAHGHAGQDDAGHDAPAPDEGHDDHGHDEAHAHSGVDPHVWLDPQNGQLWLGQIAEALAELDPDNAAQYRENAAAAQAELAALEEDIAETLAPVKSRPFIVFHDAYHYFEARFDIEARGAISENDARAPGAARVSELRDLVAESGAKCVFAEPQFNPGLIAAVTEGQGTGTGTLDPLGADLEPGAALYADLLRGMAENMAACLSD